MTEPTSYRGLAWIAAMALFMQSLDATILNTALPAISDSLHESPLEMQMAIISYALTVAALIPLSGWLADKFGTLRVFRFAVGLFVLGSIACALSSTLYELVGARILQGCGGALMMPVARLTIIRTVPKAQLLEAWNLMAMTGLIGPILGPLLGGWLVTYATWHWIFLINIPIGVIGILIAGRFMPNKTREDALGLDWLSFILFATGLVAVSLGFELISEDIEYRTKAMIVLGIGALLIAVYYFYARQAKNPLLPLSLFHVRTFRVGIMANMWIRLSGSGIPFLLPLMLQVAFHKSAEAAGWLMVPLALSSMLMKPFTAKILGFFGYKRALIANALLMTCSIALMSTLNASSSYWYFVLLIMWQGACVSLMFTAVNTLAVSDLDDSNSSAGATMLNIVQQVGIGLGIAVSAVVLSVYREMFGETGAQLEQAFSYTFLTSASCGVFLALTFSLLRKQDGNNLNKKK